MRLIVVRGIRWNLGASRLIGEKQRTTGKRLIGSFSMKIVCLRGLLFDLSTFFLWDD
jgi:hypothetical protein